MQTRSNASQVKLSRRAPRHGSYRCCLELLEDRCLPASGLSASLVADSVEVLNDFAGLAFDPNVPRFPPNPSLAAGPHHVVEAVIGGIAFFDKETGARVFAQRDADFFAPAGASSNLNDPKASYDELAGRFIVTAREVNRAARTAHLFIAVSDDADPNGAWEMHAIDISHNGEHFADFPQLGWDADAIYLSANMAPFQGGNGFVELTTIEKATLLDGDSTTITYYTTQRKWPHVTMQPAIMHGAHAGDPMYFVETVQINPGNHLLVVRMTNKLSPEPTFTEFKITVPKYNDPPAATQADGEELDTNFTWILSAAWRGGRLVASQNVGSDGHKEARARWYEFDTLGAEPLLVQSGEIDPGPGVHTYYPAIDIAPNGDLGMTFMQSSSTEFLSMYVTGRRTGDPLGTMQTPALVKAGEATYATNRPDIDAPPLRAGDHSGIGIDPIDGTFWAVSQYATPPLPPSGITANWGTWIANFSIGGGTVLPAQFLGTRSTVEPFLGQDRDAGGLLAAAMTAGTRRVPSSDSDPFVVTVLDRVFADSKTRLAAAFVDGAVLRVLLNLTKHPDGKARV